MISRAAIFGGTTTVVDFANWRTGTELPQAIERKDALFKGHSYTDYTFHCILVGMGTEGSTPQQQIQLPLAVIDQIEDLVRVDLLPSRSGQPTQPRPGQSKS